jgi:hypothetical protein
VSSPANAPGDGPLDGALQFERAEIVFSPGAPDDADTRCAGCQQPIVDRYYHAQGVTVCEACANRIRDGQQAPPPTSLLRAALFGAGAGLAGCALYATVAIVTGLEIGLIAILVGFMVGKAVRHGSNGLGGRPQQILAVVLTYFSITTSYIPVFINHAIKNPPKAEQSATGKGSSQRPESTTPPPKSVTGVIVILLLIAAAAPFLSLGSGFGAFLSLVIIFFGLHKAWALTGRTDLLIMGPYDLNAPQP